MAQRSSSAAPVAPTRQRLRSLSSSTGPAHQQQQQQRQSPVAYSRSSSASDVMTAIANNNKPPPVPRNSLIRSQQQQQHVMTSHQSSASFKAAQTAALIGYSNNNNNNKPLTNKPSVTSSEQAPVAIAIGEEEPQILSRSFTFESAGGVRRKIPVTPVLSTAGRRSPASSSAHDTLHYRQGTLVFPETAPSGVVSGRLTLTDLAGSSSSAAGSAFSIQMQSEVERLDGDGKKLLELCREGDAGTLSRYLSLMMQHNDKVISRTINNTDSSGKSGLIHAAMTGNLAITRLLVKLPAIDVNLADNEGNTALHLASQAGHADIVSLLTLCPNLYVDSRNESGITPLMKAALQGRVRCTRLLLLAGASPVLRDFGRGMCSSEWARLTGRSKCAEIIDKYMEKMQLNPGLAVKPSGVASSEPSLLLKRSSLMLLPGSSSKGTKDSWVKNTLKKALQFVGGGSSGSGSFSVANHLTGSGVMGASVLLPGDDSSTNSRRSSLPINIPTASHTLPYHLSSGGSRSPSSSSGPSFVIPRIQVSYCNSKVPPPPSRAPPIPAEMRPNRPSRSSSPAALNHH